ncbi:hypothetical protein CVT26_015219 [Gymnopilus dilepis]|uniref:Uncharacterized protein n=1 Tax=Gymnopilus dilepis TaxID=231916 RepID=A0A409W434_9AGAR|nr:hypothetical protein CVT26_015219 [Gymnopilus dilepis]
MSRAGLVFFLFFALITLATSAPLPDRLDKLVARYDSYKDDLLARSSSSFNVVMQRDYDDAGPVLYLERDYPLFLKSRDFDYGCQYDKRETSLDILYGRGVDPEEYNYFTKRGSLERPQLRRRSIFDKIRHAFSHAFNKVKSTFKKAATAIKSVARKVTHVVQHAVQKVTNKVRGGFVGMGNKMKGGFVNMGNKMNQGFQKVRQAAGKVGTFFKQNGLKIAKIGLKFIAAGATAAGKLVKFIPGVGQAVGMALKGVAMGANIGADKIHANLGGTLGKISNGLDYVISPLGSVAKKVGVPGAKDIAMDLFTRGFIEVA